MPIDRKYTGCLDSNSGSGYTGIRANIDYITPLNVCYQTNTWIGIDDVSNMIWVQIGWANEKKPSERIANYAEVHRHDDSYNIYYFTPVVGGVTYLIDKAESDAVWSIADTILHQEPWAGIVGGGTMPTCQYMVEVFDESCDYVPGNADERNYFRTIENRVTGGAYAVAGLATEHVTGQYGNVERDTGEGSATMAVWDSRTGVEMGEHSDNAKPKTTAATPSISWQDQDLPRLATPSTADAAAATYSHAAANGQSRTGQWGRLTDQFPFGSSGVMDLYRVPVAGVPPNEAGQTGGPQDIELDLFIEPESDALVLAATRSRENWALPTPDFPSADPEDALAKVGIHPVFDPSVKPKLKVEDILTAVSRDMGIEADRAGHIVLRPRMLEPSFPKTIRNGEAEPDRRMGLYWIVEVRGTEVHQIWAPGGGYIGNQTGMVILVDDTKGDAFYGVGLP